MTPLSKIKESLVSFDVPTPTIDISFTSPVRIFRSLVDPNIEVDCHDEDDEGECIFRLNNEGVTELAKALPQLESLFLGRPCFENTCTTTAACLLPISVHCLELRELEVHFNTTNIVEDLNNILAGHLFQELRLLPKCALSSLGVHRMPLTLDEPGFETAVNGMVNIFPSLKHFEGAVRDFDWKELSRRILEVQSTTLDNPSAYHVPERTDEARTVPPQSLLLCPPARIITR